VNGPALTTSLRITELATPETVAVPLACTRTAVDPTGKVIFPFHITLFAEAANDVQVAPLSREYQIEVLAALIPDKVMMPAVVIVGEGLTFGAVTVGAM
jgi:hypothetical protein